MPLQTPEEEALSHPTPPDNIKNHPQDFQTLGRLAEARGDWKAASDYYARVIGERAAELALINTVQQGLSSKLEMQAIYDLVGDILRDTFNAQVVMISSYDPQTAMIFHHYAIERGLHLQIPGWNPIDSSRAEIVRTRQPFMINLDEIIRVVADGRMHVVPGTELPKTWLGVPMLIGDEVHGIVSLQNLDDENAFSQSDIDLLTALTNSLSLSLENARLFNESQRLLRQFEYEMEIARQTQQGILPMKIPRHPGYDFGSLMIPAHSVGGDFYDFISLNNQRQCIVIGDVSDKGLPAALIMALTFSLLRAETAGDADQCQVLNNVNRYLRNMNPSGMFVTLLHSILDLKTGLLQWCRAGHLPPIILDAGGEPVTIPMDEGQPLGLFEDVNIDRQQAIIPKGGLALLFSDGLNEAVDTEGEEFGIQRVKDELAAHRRENASIICNQLWRTIQNHTGNAFHQDDFAAVVVKRL